MSSDQQPLPLPPRMQSALESYRQRVWLIKIAEGMLAGLFGLVLSYLFIFGLDRLFDTPATLRGLILLAGCVGMMILLPLKLHNWVWSRRRLDQVARLVRQRYPRFGDHLLGVVELAQSDAEPAKSHTLVHAAMKQVDAELADRDLNNAVPNPKHRRWMWTVAVPLLLGAALWTLAPAAGKNALLRWLMPWKDVERYTFAQLEDGAAPQVVPYGEAFELEARLKEDSPWKPPQAKARYGAQETLLSDREGSTYRFRIPPQTSAATVALRVGDARRGLPIEPKMRPALSELRASIKLPAYLERREPLEQEVRGGSFTIVEGSSVILTATATRELAQATLNDQPQIITGAQITTRSLQVAEPSEFQLHWQDQFGLKAREPQLLKIVPQEDRAPSVTFNKLSNQQVVLTSEVLTFEIQARDDFGLRQVGIEWLGMEDPVQKREPTSGEKIVAAGGPEEESLIVPATFSADREEIHPQTLRLRVFAEDYLPGRERSYSPYLVLHILSPADHFKWLSEQLAKWADASKEVYEKELELNETNKELMNLPPEALDDPETKEKIQDQAAAEMANAGKLSALIQAGRELVKEAAKNEEFNAQQVELLAETLKQLEEIAGKKMPSVAELLKMAAEAPSTLPSESTEEPIPGDPGEVKDSEKPGENELPPIATPPGGQELGLEKADKLGVKGENPEGLDKDPEDPNTPGGEVNVDRSEHPDGKPGYLPANPTPVVLDHESGFNKEEKATDAPQHKGGLLIPNTILKGSGNEEEGEDLTSLEILLEAVTEQQALIDTFAKLASEMNKLLLSFENSTFVKRLKAASRRQLGIATSLNDLDGFGLPKQEKLDQDSRKRLADEVVSEAQKVVTIQEDMMAYADRKRAPSYYQVLEEMEETGVVIEIRKIREIITANEIGQSTIETEFWADTLDRWAEQLVDPLPPSDGLPPLGLLVELPSLTPEIVLELLRLVDGEIKLREETRELHQAKAALVEKEYNERAHKLSSTQAAIAERARDLVPKIEELPMQGHPLMVKTIAKVVRAGSIMDEVDALLAEPQTGPQTIAAITDVIETILESVRTPNAPLVIKAPPTNVPALALVGLGDDGNNAFLEHRAPNQATGKSGRKLPEEYKEGLDAYLNALEGRTN